MIYFLFSFLFLQIYIFQPLTPKIKVSQKTPKNEHFVTTHFKAP